MSSVKRACLRVGAAAMISMVLALAVMSFLLEARPIATWFLASATLAGLSYAVAIAVGYFEQ
jgi:hypothetical protein